MEGYADRPALGERAAEPVTDPDTGRTTLRLLDRFDTVTYGELWERVGAVASEWRHHPDHAVGPGDFVAVLGSTSPEYAVLDLACVRSGAVSVPLQAGASAEHLAPVVAQTGPRLLAVDVAHLDVALQIAADAPSLGRIVVLGHRPEVTDHQEALDAARGRLAAQGRGATLDTLASVIERGRSLPPLPRVPEGSTADTLSALIYTSGSTGTPKGAVYTERLVKNFWIDFVPGQGTQPSIVLNYLPLSHMMGRGVLFGTLAKGAPPTSWRRATCRPSSWTSPWSGPPSSSWCPASATCSSSATGASRPAGTSRTKSGATPPGRRTARRRNCGRRPWAAASCGPPTARPR